MVFPEKYLNIPVDGIHPTEQWDNGISALYINYDADVNNIIDKKVIVLMIIYILGLNPALILVHGV